jgi:hypothetical protein
MASAHRPAWASTVEADIRSDHRTGVKACWIYIPRRSRIDDFDENISEAKPQNPNTQMKERSSRLTGEILDVQYKKQGLKVSQ